MDDCRSIILSQMSADLPWRRLAAFKAAQQQQIRLVVSPIYD